VGTHVLKLNSWATWTPSNLTQKPKSLTPLVSLLSLCLPRAPQLAASRAPAATCRCQRPAARRLARRPARRHPARPALATPRPDTAVPHRERGVPHNAGAFQDHPRLQPSGETAQGGQDSGGTIWPAQEALPEVQRRPGSWLEQFRGTVAC
jgi:hypothetical protein